VNELFASWERLKFFGVRGRRKMHREVAGLSKSYQVSLIEKKISIVPKKIVQSHVTLAFLLNYDFP
jgi:hypothetical protein